MVNDGELAGVWDIMVGGKVVFSSRYLDDAFDRLFFRHPATKDALCHGLG